MTSMDTILTGTSQRVERPERDLSEAAVWRGEAGFRLGKPEPGSSILVVGQEASKVAAVLKNKGLSYSVTHLETRADATPTSIKGQIEKNPVLSKRLKQLDLIVSLDFPHLEDYSEFALFAHSRLKPGGQFVVLALIQDQKPSDKQLYEFFSEHNFVNVVSQRGFRYGGITGLLARSELLESSFFSNRFGNSIAISAQKPFSLCANLAKVSLPNSLRNNVSVVVPCHNEEQNVRPLVDGLMARYGKVIHEIVLVDDNSTDDTAKILRQLAKQNSLIKPIFRKPPNGVGRAISEGVKATTGKYVMTLDCDFQHILLEIRDMFKAMVDGYDLAVGSRFTPKSLLRNYPYQKLVANRGFSAVSRILSWKNFHDVTNNCKIMRGDLYRSLTLVQSEFAVNAETGLLPIALGMKHKEVPVSWLGRSYGMGQSSFKVWKVGGGYIRVIADIVAAKYLSMGPYKSLFKEHSLDFHT